MNDNADLVAREQDARDRLRLAMEAGQMAVWDYEVASRKLTVSPELNRLMGFPEDAEPCVDDFEAGYLLGERDRLHDQIVALLARGERKVEAEFRRRGPDGVFRWLLMRADVKGDDVSSPRRYVGVLVDITERRIAEEARRESDARFRIMADAAAAPVWVTSVGGGVEFVNEAFAEYAGKPREELVGGVWLTLLHPADVAHVGAQREAARETFSPYAFEARIRGADGSYRWMVASSKPRFDANGAFQGYVGIAIDVTDRRLAQEALRESEARFREMAEAAPVMLWLSDETGRCIYLNASLREFWGVSEDLSDFEWASTVVLEDREALLRVSEKALAHQAPFEAEARYYRADGAVRTLLTRATPRQDAAGRFLGMYGVNMDVTEVRDASAKQRLLMNELNHRVKNTLASVQSMVRQTLRPGASIEAARESLFERLISLSEAHDVLTRRSWDKVEVAELVDQALRPFQDPAAPRFDVHGPRLLLGPNAALAMSLALHELGTNAVKYGALSGPGGLVVLRWVADGERVRLAWREEGGPPVSPPTRTGFGMRLLQRGLAGDPAEGAHLDFDPGGLRAAFSVKAAG